jgi:hypothetical protein
MSFTTSRDHLSPEDPLYYAPPRLRRGPDFPSDPAPAREAESDHWRPITPASRFDGLLEEAVAESLALSPESEMVPEPPAFALEHHRRRGVFSIAAGFAAAVGAAAVVAFLVVVMMPKTQTSDPAELAAAEYRALLASAMAARTQVPPEESQVLLRKFVQWQQRDGADQQLAR